MRDNINRRTASPATIHASSNGSSTRCRARAHGLVLIFPPLTPDGKERADPPLSQWEIDKSFDTASQCESVRAKGRLYAEEHFHRFPARVALLATLNTAFASLVMTAP